MLGGLLFLFVHVALLALAGLAVFLWIVARALLIALALLFLVSVTLSGILRVGLLSRLFSVHRFPFIISIKWAGTPAGSPPNDSAVLVNQVCFAQQKVSYMRRNRPNGPASP